MADEKNLIEEAITNWFGPRCDSKDTDDMGDDEARCVVCRVWEQYDELVAAKEPKNAD